jgi:mono/diheme cytochrome c family protein
MCHGAAPADNISNILRGANSSTTIVNAINTNVGGMGFLKGLISSQDASDLAAYLATPKI